tara:strand:- start:76 stop:360 length:285 start_codon:yes stop_codon:yes gene_type:complete
LTVGLSERFFETVELLAWAAQLLETDQVSTALSLQVATFVVLSGPAPEFLGVIGITGGEEIRHNILGFLEALLELPDSLTNTLGLFTGDISPVY